MYTEKELKEATQIVYLSILSKAEESLKADGLKGPFSVRELIRASINVKQSLDNAINNGVSEKDITTKELALYSDLKDSDKAIIEEFSEEMFDWKLVDIQDMNSLNGFYACCIETSKNDAIIAFRGSENMRKCSNMVNDWIRADFGLLNSRSTRQQEEAEKYGEYLLEKGIFDKYNSLAVTGHSLGGNLASHFTISSAAEGKEKIFDKIKQSINFDGPGVSDIYLEEHSDEIKKATSKMSHLKWSAVGDLLFDIPGEKIEFLDINDDLYKDDLIERAKYKIITRHSTKSLLFDENGYAERGKQDIVSKGLGNFSRTLDAVLPESVTNELYAAADWIFERVLRFKERRSLEFKDDSWAERFANKGSFLGKCANFINKVLDVFEEGVIALGEGFAEILPKGEGLGPTLKPAFVDVYNGIGEDYNYNLTYMDNARNMLNIKEKNKDSKERE